MIYVGCPANLFSGGPELAHQLCHEISQCGSFSKMCYFGAGRKLVCYGVKGTKYECYHTESCASMEEIDQEENCLIVPETAVSLGYRCTKCRVIIYWMSVDNYFVNLEEEEDKAFRSFFSEERVLHIVQSQYACHFCMEKLKIPADRVLFVSDYITREYIGDYENEKREKKNYICYNPVKGFDVISRLIYRYPEYCWIPLYGLSAEEMIERLSVSKVYIDFGAHPGKDRIPREAVACGCCIITNKRGAAANLVDIPIPEKYKIEDETEFETVIHRIDDIFDNYLSCRKDFSHYDELIRVERKTFIKQVYELLEYIDRWTI